MLPVMLRYVPGASRAGLTWYRDGKASVVSPKFQPAWKAATLAAMISGRLPNLALRKASVPSAGRSYSQDSMPSANMFLDRSASLLVRSYSSRALTVSEVIGTACRWYCSSEPSSSGLTP